MMEKKTPIRIAGYLEKKGKVRMMVSRWKRWWFVLEGRLLLYYQSQLEYLNLSPCRGSLNMGLAASVRPGKALQLVVNTRSQTVILRASNCDEHEHWLQSLVDAMAPHNSTSTYNPRPVMHFRYRENYHENIIQHVKNFKCPSYGAIFDDKGLTPARSGSCKTSSSSLGQNQSQKCMLRRVFSDSRTLLRRPCKRNSSRSSIRFSKIAFSDTSIPVISEVKPLSQAHSSEKCQSMQELRDSSSEDELQVSNLANGQKAVTGSRESKLSSSIKIELNLEEVDSKKGENLKEHKIGNVKIVLDGCSIYGSTAIQEEHNKNNKQNCSIKNDCVEYQDLKQMNIHLYQSNEAKSDTDLVTMRHRVRLHSFSCDNMQTLDRSIGSTFHDTSSKIEVSGTEKKEVKLLDSPKGCLRRNPNKKRSNSILSRLRDNNSETDNGNFERGGTIRKRLSFLRKMWKRREKKTEEEVYESNDYESIPVIIDLESPEIVDKPKELLKPFSDKDCPDPEPPPDYDISLTEEEIPPMLPPRQQKQRPHSPWHDIPKNNQPVKPLQEDIPPPLPKKHKQKNNCLMISEQLQPNLDEMNQLINSQNDDSITCEPPSINGEQQSEDLDTLLAKLTEVNTYVVRQIDISQNRTDKVFQVSAAKVEPVYDVPRPHLSLVGTLRSLKIRSETFTPTHFLCTTPVVDVDSLDPVISRLELEMTPDSLECDSQWSLAPASSGSHSNLSGSMLHHFIATEDKFFPDSLST